MTKRIFGIDVGEARIGLAVSDELGLLAHPLETIQVKEGRAIHRIAGIMKREKVTTAVVGLPRNMDGSYGPAAEKVRTFATKLQELLPCEVIFEDERLSTVAAQRSLHAAGRNEKKSRAVVDQVAAQIILQGYLDAQALRHGPMFGEP
ncbi:MAG TPA: Holliday junction resolvase RuvX [Chthoniobacteraceae bacterium]|nr:Holliday junction resolvase RuvX [Chthoniobacteraceae bacterium]